VADANYSDGASPPHFFESTVLEKGESDHGHELPTALNDRGACGVVHRLQRANGQAPRIFCPVIQFAQCHGYSFCSTDTLMWVKILGLEPPLHTRVHVWNFS
jgi:hypothetical protein